MSVVSEFSNNNYKTEEITQFENSINFSNNNEKNNRNYKVSKYY